MRIFLYMGSMIMVQHPNGVIFFDDMIGLYGHG
jgi:hypothetical protein